MAEQDKSATRAWTLDASVLAQTSWLQTLNPRIEVSDGGVDVYLEPSAELLNHNGAISGPALLGIGEIATGALVVEAAAGLLETAYFVVREVQVEYLRPARAAVVSRSVASRGDLRAAWGAVQGGNPADVWLGFVVVDAVRATLEVARGELLYSLRPPRA